MNIYTVRTPFLILLILSGIFLSLLPKPLPAQEFQSKNITLIPPQEYRYFKTLPGLPNDPLKILSVRLKIRQANHMLWQHTDSAIFLLYQALNESQRLGYQSGISYSHMNLGMAAMAKGNYDESYRQYYLSYTHIPLNRSHDQTLTTLFVNIGATYAYQANYAQAAHFYYSVLQFMLEHRPDDPNLLMTYNNLADVFLHMQQYDQAESYLREAMTRAEKKKDKFILAYLYVNLAEVEAHYHHFDTAEYYYQNSLSYAIQTKNADIEQAALSCKGKMLLLQGQTDSAIYFLQKAFALNSKAFPYYSTILPSYNLGTAYFTAGQYQNAERAILFGLQKAHQTGIRQSEIEALTTLTEIYQMTGQHTNELDARRQLKGLGDAVQNSSKLQALTNLEIKYQTAQKDKQIAENRLLILSQKARIQNNRFWTGISLLLLLTLGIIFVSLFIANRHKNRIATLNAMMEGENKERERMARELHDGIGGMLAATQMQCSMEKQSHSLNDISQMLDNIAQEVRNTAHNLMPSSILHFSLKDALMEYCRKMTDIHAPFSAELQILTELPELSPSERLNIYRIVQEALQNILKHAQASQATIQLSYHNKVLHLLIEDNGIGFDPRATRKGIGLSNLISRAHLLKGNASIESHPENGTTLRFEFPVK